MRATLTPSELYEAVRFPESVLRRAALDPGVDVRRPSFQNPAGPGYGSTQWPFDWHKAVWSDGYRSGVFNAMVADWTASNWKFATQKLLDQVWRLRAQARVLSNKSGVPFEEVLSIMT